MSIPVRTTIQITDTTTLGAGTHPASPAGQRPRRPRRSWHLRANGVVLAYVALAGPLTNFAIALVCMIAIPFAGIVQGALEFSPILTVLTQEFLFLTVLNNVFLGAFNLVPIPPLDGGRIAVGFLPLGLARYWARLEPFGIYIVFFLLLTGAIDLLITPIQALLMWLSKFLL